jgi:hypothetical protein
LRFDYKHTRVKQYFKLDKALRTETTFNDTYDFKIGRNLGNLPRLRTLGRHINHRLLSLERVAQHCAIASHTVERIVLPTVDDGQRAPALRWGDPRTMALFSALCAFSAAPEGITNRSLRERVGSLYDAGPKGYTQNRMSHDLRRLRLKGLPPAPLTTLRPDAAGPPRRPLHEQVLCPPRPSRAEPPRSLAAGSLARSSPPRLARL